LSLKLAQGAKPQPKIAQSGRKTLRRSETQQTIGGLRRTAVF
jgi:hypothetical protein